MSGDSCSYHKKVTGLSYQHRLPFLRHPSRYRRLYEGHTNRFLNFQDTSLRPRMDDSDGMGVQRGAGRSPAGFFCPAQAPKTPQNV